LARFHVAASTVQRALTRVNRNVHTSDTVGSDKHDRITPTVDLANLALDFEEETEEAPTDEVRAVVSPSMLPRLLFTVDQIRDLPIDPRTAFLISLVDGQCSVGMIAHIAGVPGDDAINVFAMLLQLGAVELRDPR
jgi:hypothetical protein